MREQFHSPAPSAQTTDINPLEGASAPIQRERSYYGCRHTDGSAEVWYEERAAEKTRRPLPSCLEIRNHSPSGFAWGYGGSGPAQLALALLVDALGDSELAQQHYQDFKFAVVSRWDSNWSITAKEIRDFVSRQM